jgi:hypothetical protein
VVGNGVLWTLPPASYHVGYSPHFDDPSTGEWGIKFPWYRRKAGVLTVTGKRLGGPRTFRANLAPAKSYAPTGPLPSTPTFSAAGCWRVVGRLLTAKVVLSIEIDGSQHAICADLDGQLRNVRAIDGRTDDDLVIALEAARRAHHCSAGRHGDDARATHRTMPSPAPTDDTPS